MGAGSFYIVWWGYKNMLPIDGGSKIHSSWMGVAKMLPIFTGYLSGRENYAQSDGGR